MKHKGYTVAGVNPYPVCLVSCLCVCVLFWPAPSAYTELVPTLFCLPMFISSFRPLIPIYLLTM